MDTLSARSFSFSLPTYSQLTHCYDPERNALWYYMNPKPRPCFTRTLLEEIRDLQDRVKEHVRSSPKADEIRYLIMASAVPGVFNLGGDLNMFLRYIDEKNRDGLYQYGRICVDVVYHNVIHLGVDNLTTIALVQGSALGGGFEAALSNNVLVAENNGQMGFPEILFNLFPGMGAYSFLARRVGTVRTEQLLRTGEQLGGRELSDLGVVDVLAPEGEGVHTVIEFIRRRNRSWIGQQAIQQVRQRVNPVTYEELLDIVEIWVDAALCLPGRDRRMIARLVAAQNRLDLPSEATSARNPRNVAVMRAPSPGIANEVVLAN